MSHGRVDYDGDGLTEEALLDTPYAQARAWVDDAVARAQVSPDVFEPLAISVATVDADGRPNVRTVLMRFFDERGPGFVTALTSAKGRELTVDLRGGGVPDLAGDVPGDPVPRHRASRCPATRSSSTSTRRPWASRISAWASRQSEPIESRAELEAQYAAAGGGLPRPRRRRRRAGARLLGWLPDRARRGRVLGGRRNRLHDRLVFTRVGEGDLGDADSWEVHRRQP